MPTLASLLGGTKPFDTLVLEPPGHVFEGPVAVRHPLTIQGQGCTVRAPTGPALVIQSTGVILEDLTVEVTGDETLTGEAACALVARAAVRGLKRVAVRGDVIGIPGEEGDWLYPRL